VAESSTHRERATKAAADKPEAEAAKVGDPEEMQWPVGQLVEDCSVLLGYPVYAVSPALDGHDSEEMMTVSDAKALVETWLQTPVQVDPATQQEDEEA